jgi:hypothetical protein
MSYIIRPNQSMRAGEYANSAAAAANNNADFRFSAEHEPIAD